MKLEVPYNPESYYMSFDPGETTGWAGFSKEGQELCVGQVKSLDGLSDFLEEIEIPGLIILEEFKLYSWKARQQSGSDMIASQAIGSVKNYARRNSIQVIEQPASIKSIAQLWSGVKPTGNHKHSHWVDAYNHGIYYLQKNDIRKSIADKRD